MDVIHRPVRYLKHSDSKTGFCLRFQMEPTQLDQKWRRRQNPVSEALCFKKKTGR
jgi:hypothetical protein